MMKRRPPIKTEPAPGSAAAGPTGCDGCRYFAPAALRVDTGGFTETVFDLCVHLQWINEPHEYRVIKEDHSTAPPDWCPLLAEPARSSKATTPAPSPADKPDAR